MRLFIFLLVFALPVGLVRAQRQPSAIDKIQTKEQANDFFEGETYAGKSRTMEIYGKKPGQDSLSVPGWFYKLDLDGDGRTDLLMNGRIVLAIVDRGVHGYYLCGLGSFGDDINSARLVGIDSSHRPARLLIQRFTKHTLDTLVFRMGAFFEYNPRPLKHFKFDSVTYHIGGGDMQPVYSLRIDRFGHVDYDAGDNNERKGHFRDSLSPATLDTLVKMAGYLPLDRMDSVYTLGAKNGLEIQLDIFYNGKVVHIVDRGGGGSWGLESVYHRFLLLHLKMEDPADWNFAPPPARKGRLKATHQRFLPPMIVRPDSTGRY